MLVDIFRKYRSANFSAQFSLALSSNLLSAAGHRENFPLVFIKNHNDLKPQENDGVDGEYEEYPDYEEEEEEVCSGSIVYSMFFEYRNVFSG